MRGQGENGPVNSILARTMRERLSAETEMREGMRRRARARLSKAGVVLPPRPPLAVSSPGRAVSPVALCSARSYRSTRLKTASCGEREGKQRRRRAAGRETHALPRHLPLPAVVCATRRL